MLPNSYRHDPPSDGEAPEREILRTYFENLLYLLRRQGVGLAEEALCRVRLTRDDVATASERLSFDAFYALLSWLHASHALPVPGLQLGLRLSLRDFGIFGQALLGAGRSGEALNLAQRFYGSAWRHVRLEVFRERDMVVCRYLPQPSAVCHPVPLAQAMTAMSAAVTRELVPGVEPDRFEVRYGFRTPPDASEYRRRLGCRVQFGHAWHEVRQPAAWLEQPRDPCSVVSAAPLRALGAWQRQQHPVEIEGRVRQLLMAQCDDGFPSQEEVARRIGIASRTLRQRLAARGVSFRALLLEIRLDMARRHLARTGVSAAEAGALAGYRHPASFHRAYRQCFGVAPGHDGESG
ncbi:AraC family transcriptional regulator [Variovorax sp. LjRoot175]|uniref:AraC family transcriptional regulator n=1 Tax=Variovorax sp. LjRoot175 TaxID=3342276 RepID=UPI003ECEAB64